jgi:prepilin-type N-terminal cleavage/methylation domain-containing protein
MPRLPKREGFTLIELMIVIVIIGILATIVVSAYWRVKNRGYEASLQHDLRNAALQQEQYFAAHQIYAGQADYLSEYDPSAGVTLDINYAQRDGWAGVATHQSMPDRYCGYYTGAASAADAGPATSNGIVQCGDR